MATNIFDIRRTAFANITFPGSNSTTVSTGSGTYIPKGAIITDIRVMAGDAVTLSQLSNCTCNIYVGTQVIGSNNIVASSWAIQTVAKSVPLVNTIGGVYVGAGGNVILHLGSGSSVTGGLVADMDIYVDYLYCNDRDDA